MTFSSQHFSSLIFPHFSLYINILTSLSAVLNWYNELRCCCFHILRYRLEATRDGARKCSIVNKRKNSERKVRKFSISTRKKRCRLLISIKRREIPKNANIAKLQQKNLGRSESNRMLNIADEIIPWCDLWFFILVSNLRVRTLQWCILELDYSHNKHKLNSSLKRAQDRRTCKWVEKVSSSPYFFRACKSHLREVRKSHSLTLRYFSHKNDKKEIHANENKFTLERLNVCGMRASVWVLRKWHQQQKTHFEWMAAEIWVFYFL